METKVETDGQIEAAAVLLDGGVDLEAEPKTWHGDLSFASLVLLPFGISATKFVDAPMDVREIAIEHLADAEKKRAIRSLTLCFIVAIGFAILLNPAWRMVACGGAAIKAGVDLGRFTARKRTLTSARTLEEKDLEIVKPVDIQD